MTVTLKGPAIRRILARRHRSQNDLARALGTTSGYVSQLLAGVRTPSPLMRQKILSALGEGYRFDDLFLLASGRQARNGRRRGN
jgi:transcriptional regulator with XRE-family HTH domain